MTTTTLETTADPLVEAVIASLADRTPFGLSNQAQIMDAVSRVVSDVFRQATPAAARDLDPDVDLPFDDAFNREYDAAIKRVTRVTVAALHEVAVLEAATFAAEPSVVAFDSQGETTAKPIDLMAALEASVEAARAGKARRAAKPSNVVALAGWVRRRENS